MGWFSCNLMYTFTQARETLRLILETQINRRRKAKQDLDEFDSVMFFESDELTHAC